jgi:hypothetical protein
METQVIKAVKFEENEGQSSCKIDVNANIKNYFVLIDTFTNAIIGVYNSNVRANRVMINLVKNQLYLLIKHERDLLMMSKDTLEEKRKSLSFLKSYIYHLKTIDQTNQVHIIGEEGNILRYVIKTIRQDETDDDPSEENNVLI